MALAYRFGPGLLHLPWAIARLFALKSCFGPGLLPLPWAHKTQRHMPMHKQPEEKLADRPCMLVLCSLFAPLIALAKSILYL
jgi:hypothetical protein